MSNISPINDITSIAYDEILDEQFSNLDLDVLLLSIIDNVPSNVLPHLSEQYHITGNEGWIQCRDDDEKRELIKNAIEIHKYKGTKYGLKKIFEMFGLESDIKEWFETEEGKQNIAQACACFADRPTGCEGEREGDEPCRQPDTQLGEPFTFSVNLDFATSGFDYELVSKIEDLIAEYKNARSHLSNINISLSSQISNNKYKLATLSGELTTVYPYQEALIFDEQNWDEAYWQNPISEIDGLGYMNFDESTFDESMWCFG